MRILDVLDIVHGKCDNMKDRIVKGFAIDSRCIQNGDVFIALKGKNYDGNDYIEDAIKNGASAIITEKKTKCKVSVIEVLDTYDSLRCIGKYYRDNFKGKVIAITGSAGKTTTKELISLILSKKYRVLKSEGNKNNHIGLPMTLMNLNNSYDMCVVELGMNHLGEIAHLSKICKPDIGIITNIGTAHIGNLGSKKNIFKAKMEITNGIKEKLIVNGYDKYLKKVKLKNIELVNTNDLHVTKIVCDLQHSEFFVKKNDKEYKFTLNMIGKHLIQNCLLAIKVGEEYGVPFEDMIDAIKEYKTLDKRLNVKNYGNNILIDDSYNSNYESVKELIEYISKIDKEKLIILADILELGKYSKKIHQKIGKLLRKKKLKNVIFIGKNMYYAYKKNKSGIYFNTNDECTNYLHSLDLENKLILIKGSHGMHLEQIVSLLEEKMK